MMPPKKRSIDPSMIELNVTDSIKWNLNDRVLCRYENSDIYYEAKIIDVTSRNNENVYKVHYQGWNSRHDEKIPESKAVERFKPYTEEDAEHARDVVKKAQQDRKKRKSTTFSVAQDGKRSNLSSGGGDDSSRASTPSIRSIAETSGKGRRSRAVSSVQSSAVGDTAIVEMTEKERENKKITLPLPLRKILTDDHNMINVQHMLPKIPARVNVEDIVQQYRQSLADSKFREMTDKEFLLENSDYPDDCTIAPSAETCEQSALGLLDYFDMTVGTLLLYKFEKPMYSDLHASECEKLGIKSENYNSNKDGETGTIRIRYSKHFGLVHFLRLFTRFTETLQFTQWSARAMDAIVRHAQDFVIFLSKRCDDFYDVDQDYIIASPEYLKRVWGGANQ